MPPLTFRAIWISDTHLGARYVHSQLLLDFLRHTESEYLYLVGDIFDFWKRGRRWHWPPVNRAIVRLILAKARQGTTVVYIPGNHDQDLRRYAGRTVQGVRIAAEAIHETAGGQRFVVLHGDEFDCVSQYSAWLARLGSVAYELLLEANRWFNRGRQRLGLGYWSLSAFLKHRVKEAVNFIGNFESAVVREARRRQVHGLVCGHIHHAAVKSVEGISYHNIGDWVESCTALAERQDGTLGIIRWAERRPLQPLTVTAHAHRYRHRRLAPTG